MVVYYTSFLSSRIVAALVVVVFRSSCSSSFGYLSTQYALYALLLPC
jgi:hypothetical protein